MSPSYYGLVAMINMISNFEFIVLKYPQIYHKSYKYLFFNKYIKLQYHGIEKFMTVSKIDIVVLLKFDILHSPNEWIHVYTVTWLSNDEIK